jgi:hypothetical protein
MVIVSTGGPGTRSTSSRAAAVRCGCCCGERAANDRRSWSGLYEKTIRWLGLAPAPCASNTSSAPFVRRGRPGNSDAIQHLRSPRGVAGGLGVVA